MVTRTANIYIYDNFNIGVAEVVENEASDKYHHLSFTEQDYPDELAHLNPSHVFKVHEDQLDKYIEMLQGLRGKKHIHVPQPGEGPNGIGH